MLGNSLHIKKNLHLKTWPQLNLFQLDNIQLFLHGMLLQATCGDNEEGGNLLPRSKPFKYTYEKEIVMYAYFKKLDYFSTECIYSPNAYRGHARTFIKDLEKIRPSSIMDIIHSGENLVFKSNVKDRLPTQGNCTRCGYVSSMDICKACLLLEGLNKGLPKLGIGKTSKVRRPQIPTEEQF